MSKHGSSSTKCAESGIWTPVPPPATINPLDFGTIDPAQNQQVTTSGQMTFAMVGCSGDPDTQANTAAVAAAISNSGDTSFFYHLGDITYKPSGSGSAGYDEFTMWNVQFLSPYTKYPRRIVSIAGNHDGPASTTLQESQLANYIANFCSNPANWPAPWAQNTTDQRPAMIQPHLYWRFDTPLAYIIGLYTNVVNGGMLDDPSLYPDFTQGPQYQWLVSQLQQVAAANAQNSPKKAVLLAVHYPPYSGATNFNVRGDPGQGPTPDASKAPYLGVALQQAFSDSGQRPDAIFSAHAHLYQRLSYVFADGFVMPCVVAGCGGHTPLEVLSEQCNGAPGESGTPPFAAVTPGSFQFPAGDSAQVESYEDLNNGGQFGYLHVALQARTLTCEFIDAAGTVRDQFSLNLDAHQYLTQASA